MLSNKVVTIIQARMGSSRIPGKVLLSLAGEPLLFRLIERVARSKHIGKIVVATTNDPHDDIIAATCRDRGIAVYRGSGFDLLDRHYRAAKAHDAGIVVKIPSDCPLISPSIINAVISFFLSNQADYDFVSNLHPATYPNGNDVEVMSFRSLETAWIEASQPLEREHTTPFIWNNSDRFRIGNVRWETRYNYSMTHRWRIDFDEDYSFIRAVYTMLYKNNPRFELYDILHLLEKEKHLSKINQHLTRVHWYQHCDNGITTISSEETRNFV